MPCLILIQNEEISRVSGCQVKINAAEKNSVSGCLLPLRIIEKQAIKEYQFNSDFHKEKFNIAVIIDGKEIDFCKLRNEIKITNAVNSSRIAELAIAADCGLLDFYKYASKEIQIIYSSDTATQVIYSGIVISQKLDKQNKVFNLSCSDEKINKIDNLPQSTIDNLGYYCADLFNEELDKVQIFNKRLDTLPADYYFDNNGNFVLTFWQPKNYADIIIDKCSVLPNTLNFVVASVNDILNKVELKLNFNYYRFLQRDINATYNPNYGGNGSFTPQFVNIVKTYGVVPVPRVDTVLNAVNGAGWTVGNFSHIGIGDLSSGVLGGIIINDRDSYVMGATWRISKRWVQNVQEEYSITIKNDDSIAFFNERKEELQFNLRQPESEVENLKTDWTDYPCYLPPPSGGRWQFNDYILPENTTNALRYAYAMQYALNVAQTKILRSHFSNEISFDIVFNRHLELKHTIALNEVEFIGNVKVQEIVHTIDLNKRIAKTSVKAKWFKGFSGGNIRQPERVTLPILSHPQGTLRFGNKIKRKYSSTKYYTTNGGGKDYCLAKDGYDNEYGYILQEFILDEINTNAKEGILSPVKFAIKTPDIEKEMTDALTATTAAVQNIAIPDTPITASINC